MKKFLTIIFLSFFFINISHSDNIKDFEIEGISIGDSALDFFTIKELNNSLDITDYLDVYRYYFFPYPKGKEYDYLQITVKQKDKKYIIHDLQGHIFYENNIKKCFKKIDEIKKDIDEVLNYKGTDSSGKHWLDKTGQSEYRRIYYRLTTGVAEIICYNMSKKMESEGKYDRFAITLSDKEFKQWLTANHSKMIK